MKRLASVAAVAGAIATVVIAAPTADALPSVVAGSGCNFLNRSGVVQFLPDSSYNLVTLADGTLIVYCRGTGFGPGPTKTFSSGFGCDEYSQTILPNGYVTSRCVVYA